MTFIITICLILATPTFIALIISYVSDCAKDEKAKSTLKRATQIASGAFIICMAMGFIYPYIEYRNALPNVTIKEDIEISGTSDITIDDLLTSNSIGTFPNDFYICSATWEDGTCNGVNIMNGKTTNYPNTRIVLSDYTPGDTLLIYVRCEGGHVANFEADLYKIPVTLK